MTDALPEEQREALQGEIALGRLGEPKEIAYAVAFLASEQADYITGQTLHVNGGMYMELDWPCLNLSSLAIDLTP